MPVGAGSLKRAAKTVSGEAKQENMQETKPEPGSEAAVETKAPGEEKKAPAAKAGAAGGKKTSGRTVRAKGSLKSGEERTQVKNTENITGAGYTSGIKCELPDYLL